jgi:hypothetical protein
MADFTEERVPRRKNFAGEKVNFECDDCLYLRVRLHQSSGSEAPPENGKERAHVFVWPI